MLLGLLAALTLTPYLGGRELAVFGGSSVRIPTADRDWVWRFVVAAPIIWTLLVARLAGASAVRVLLLLVGAIIASLLVLTICKTIPTMVLTAMAQNFEVRCRFEFLDQQATMDVGTRPNEYCHFRTIADLNVCDRVDADDFRVEPGCALRIDQIEVEGNAYTDTKAEDIMDLDVFAGSHLLPKVNECVPAPRWREVMSSPDNAAVIGNVVLGVPKEIYTSGSMQVVTYGAVYDFAKRETGGRPVKLWHKPLRRRDMYINDTTPGPFVQLSGWSLSGNLPFARFHSLSATVRGRSACGFWFSSNASSRSELTAP